MKALDTNLIIRLLINDDPAQSAKVKALLETTEASHEQCFIATPVLLEVVWVLESVYECPRDKIVAAFETMALIPVFLFESPEVIKEFVRYARQSNTDLSDILVGLSGQMHTCRKTLTFDKKAAKSDLFELLG